VTLLEVSDLHRAYGGVRAVDGATFTVRRGTITGLIGPNGAGKSTVVDLVTGQVRPDRGQIGFDGRPIAGAPPYAVARLGIRRTFQRPNLFAHLTVLENVLLGARPWPGESLGRALLGRWSWRRHEAALRARARDLLAEVGLTEQADAYAGELSGGQKRLVELARALLGEPTLLLLDEPMAGVAPALADRLANLLAQRRSAGLTMLMIDHDLAMVERLCDPVVVMAQGRVLADGPMARLREDREVVDAYLGG
jgi:ABC-type branched-subunit amino acid transport system ATPase component